MRNEFSLKKNKAKLMEDVPYSVKRTKGARIFFVITCLCFDAHSKRTSFTSSGEL